MFPIKPGRHSGFLFPQFEFGFSNRAGQFLRNAGYYWAPNDYIDLTLAGDYYQAQPVVRAARRRQLQAAVRASTAQFSGRFERNELTHSEDYVFDGSHTQDVTPRTRFIARGNFVSSRDYSASALSGSTLEQRLNRFLTSSLSISHSADWASFNAVIDRRQDLDADQSPRSGQPPAHACIAAEPDDQRAEPLGAVFPRARWAVTRCSATRRPRPCCARPT